MVLNVALSTRGGGTFISGVHRDVPCFRVIFSMENSGKGISVFHKNSGKSDNIWKKFHCLR